MTWQELYIMWPEEGGSFLALSLFAKHFDCLSVVLRDAQDLTKW